MTETEERGKLVRPFLLEDPEVPMRRARRRRVAVLMVAILVAVAVTASVSRYVIETRDTAQTYLRWMQHDLERLGVAQNRFRAQHGTYGTLSDLGRAYVPSQGVTVRVRADSAGWSATAIHVRSPVHCIVSGGIGPSALINLPSGEVRCR